MVAAYSVLLFLIGLILFFYRKGEYFLSYIVIWFLFAPVLVAFISTLTIDDYWEINSWINKLFLLLVIVNLPNFMRKSKVNVKIGIFFLLWVVYVLMLSIYRGTFHTDFVKSGIGTFIPILMAFYILNLQTNKSNLFKIITFSYYFELVLGLCQIFVPELNFESASPRSLIRIAGTTIGNNVYAELMIMLFSIVFYMRLIKNKRITKIMIIELAVILCMVLLSSIRIALIAYLVMIMMFVFDYFRKYIKGFKKYIVYISLIISACLLFSAIQSYSNQIGVTYTKDAENSIERQNILFSIFQDADYLTTHTTFALTYDVLSHFFESPLIGPGLYYVGSGYAGYINFLEVNRSDATLAIYICEFGVIGLLFLLFFYSVFIKTYGSDNRYLLYALITLLIVSVTDNGIFYSCNNVLLLLFVLVGSERVNIINRS